MSDIPIWLKTFSSIIYVRSNIFLPLWDSGKVWMLMNPIRRFFGFIWVKVISEAGFLLFSKFFKLGFLLWRYWRTIWLGYTIPWSNWVQFPRVHNHNSILPGRCALLSWGGAGPVDPGSFIQKSVGLSVFWLFQNPAPLPLKCSRCTEMILICMIICLLQRR